MSYNSTAYNEEYYKSHCGECYERGNGWEEIFARQAEIIVRDFNPQKTLDVGCAAGYLVEGLRDRGVEAYGIDVSEYALSVVREDIKPFCSYHSATEQIDGKYDLVTCIEVLEHLQNNVDIKDAIKNICQITDTIIFSSTPFDFGEETHFSVNSPGYWCEEFAANGFYHDINYDCSYFAVQTMLFRKREVSPRELVREYENKLFELWNQSCILRDKNNIANARINDLDRGNLQHASELKALSDKLYEVEVSNNNKIYELEVANNTKDEELKLLKEKLEEANKENEILSVHCENLESNLKTLKEKHVDLIKLEYEKRDILETKFTVLKNERKFLEAELYRYMKLQEEKSTVSEVVVQQVKTNTLVTKIKNKWLVRKMLKKPMDYWKEVFDADYYAFQNSDVVKELGTDKRKLLEHYIKHGIDEARNAHPAFSVNAYMYYNNDVTTHYNGDKKRIVLHYLDIGKTEGRRCS